MLPTNSTPDTTAPAHNNRRRVAFIVATLVFIIIAVAAFFYNRLVLSHEVSTDNAYVEGNLVNITAQIPGKVDFVGADATNQVKQGDILIRLDVAQAKMIADSAKANLEGMIKKSKEQYLSLAQLRAMVNVRHDQWVLANDALARRQPLSGTGAIPQEAIEAAKQQLAAAAAALEAAKAQLIATQAAITGSDISQYPAVKAAQAQYVQALLNEEHTTISTPITGLVAKRAVQLGNFVQPGQTLMTIIPLNELWVTANFKESELKNVHIGQPVTLYADMYDSDIPFHGTVIGLSPSTGSAMSLLPVQNASGNWIKVVQRVPVRIAINPKELLAHPLRVGLSMQVKIDTDAKPIAVIAPSTTAKPSLAASQTRALDNIDLEKAQTQARQVIKKVAFISHNQKAG